MKAPSNYPLEPPVEQQVRSGITGEMRSPRLSGSVGAAGTIRYAAQGWVARTPESTALESSPYCLVERQHTSYNKNVSGSAHFVRFDLHGLER